MGDTGQGLVSATSLDDDADRGGRLTEIDTGDLDACRVCDRGSVGPGRPVDDGAESLRTGKHVAVDSEILLVSKGGKGGLAERDGRDGDEKEDDCLYARSDVRCNRMALSEMMNGLTSRRR